MDTARLKKQAGEWAVDSFIEDGLIVGLGHGSTAAFAVERIAEKIDAGALQKILGVPCSNEVARAAERLGIPLTTLNEQPSIDLTIDGADEVDVHMNLIKGGGGALLREKIVAAASRREIIVVDASKLSPNLGTRFALPVEVVPFGWNVEARFLESLGARVKRREEPDPFLTDQGNFILDCRFGPIQTPKELAKELDARPGIVAHGLFLDLVSDLVVADARGVHHYRKGQDLTEAIGR